MPTHSEITELIDHFFRHESGKIISILTRIFGTHNIHLAEDVVQDSLLEALSIWSYKGIPEKPVAWLYTVAKNKALNVMEREKYKSRFASEAVNFLQTENNELATTEHLFSEQQIIDDQLRMMFTCCHPSNTIDSQVALTLKTLCGFSILEIAKAFLTTETNITKRLVRARQKIREANIAFEVPEGKELENRIDAVLETIYLLFNEGYSASKGADVIRYELCEEAIRLTEIIAAHRAIQKKSNVYALLALMLLNASRFRSRQDEEGNIIPMPEQNRTLWNRALINRGIFYLGKATTDNNISVYHILAGISAHHCAAPDFASTDWNSILSLYDKLLLLDNSPVVILNRTIALSKVKNPEAAIEELEKIKNNPLLQSYYLFYATKAEFHIQLNQFLNAANDLAKAIHLTTLNAEKQLLQRKLDFCKKQSR